MGEVFAVEDVVEEEKKMIMTERNWGETNFLPSLGFCFLMLMT